MTIMNEVGMKKVILTISVVMAVMIISPTMLSAVEAWGYSVQSDGDDCLYRINLTSGTATKIGPVGYGDVEGLSFQPGTGILFGWNNGGHLITIDLVSGTGTYVGPSGVSGQFDAGLTFDGNGDLFVSKSTDSELYSANPNTGLVSLIGYTSGMDVIALEDAGGNSLWGVSQEHDDQPLSFVSLSKITGAATLIGNVGLGSGVSHGVGIDYTPDGTLWGIADSGAIFTIDTVTGQGTVTANTLSGFEGLAVIPEPATLSLLAVGAMALIRRRRKKIQLNITCSSPLWERRSRLNLQREARAFSLTRTCLKAATGQVPIVGCPSLAHSIEGLGPDAKGESGISRFAHFAGTQEVRSKKEKKMKRVEMSLLVCLAGSIAVVLCGFCSAVNAAVITFDEIPPANGNFGFLTDEYAHLSILFETTDDGSIFGGISAGDPGNWDLEGTNGPAFLGFNGSSYSLATTFFEQDMNYVSLDVSRSNGSSAGNTFTLEAYDGGTLVDARTVILGPINDWTSVTVSGPGIDRTEWYGEGSGFHPFGVDNLYFIPEPATLSLLAAGALALIRRRRK
ncbi:MAG: PEP-CTERM sorting domain-containing protein [Phycisphaerae bacterium]|nr:PEP-CTERM sorting domain-containing protein [Phycisphaerae bacterium]